MTQDKVEVVLSRKDLRKKKKRWQKNVNRRRKPVENRFNRIIKVVFFILLAFIVVKGVISCVSLKSQEHEIEQQYKDTLAQKEKLEETIEYINTPEYIEQEARETLRMVMPGEMLFVFKDSGESDENENSN